MRVAILGGYGVFGGRLAQLLADAQGLELLICGRNSTNAQTFCDHFEGRAKVTPLQLDRQALAEHLPQMNVQIVVDASGPFQDYGDDPYTTVRACIAAGVHYIDFADAADFVFGISQFDAAAKSAGVFVLPGASSFPVLTAAVLRQMAQEMELLEVKGGIAPSPFAGIGLNVMRAVIGYAGAPINLWRDGKQTQAYGLAESLRYTVAPPGEMPLHNIHFSLVDVPDLLVIPPEHPTLRGIWMGAGPVPETLHRILNVLAKLRATLHLPPLTPMSSLFYRVLNLMRFGEHRGGMFVDAQGTKDGQPYAMSWHLLAEGDDGPLIPSMAIEAILRKAIAGNFPETGARPATHALELSDYDRLFQNRTIFTGWRRPAPQNAPLYRRVLDEAFDKLPLSIRTLHELETEQHWHGSANVTRGTNPLARLIARLIGFPPQGDDVPVTVTLTPQGDSELWGRQFGPSRFKSTQSQGQGRNQHLLLERFGPITVALALVVDSGRLYLKPRRWSVLGIPLPKALLPGGASFEHATDGHFNFDVTISAPIIGLIVRYQGRLQQGRPAENS